MPPRLRRVTLVLLSLVMLLVIIAMGDLPSTVLREWASPRNALVRRIDSQWRICDTPDPMLARFRCTWRWTRDSPERLRPWEREYAYLYEVEFAVNSITEVSQERLREPQRRLARQLDLVSDNYTNLTPPFPILVTTTDYTDMVRAPAFDVAFRGQHHEIADAVAAVDMSTGMLIDTCNRGSGFGFGTKVAHAGHVFVDNYEYVLKRDLLGHDDEVTHRLLNDSAGYYWGMDWFPDYPGHKVDDILYHFASHWSTGSRSRTLLMLRSDASILKAFLHMLLHHYNGVQVQVVDHSTVYHALNVRFGAVQDTGYTPHVYRFLATEIVPSVVAKHLALGTPAHRNIIMVKATEKGGARSTMKMSERFRSLAEGHNFTITPAAEFSVEHRTFLVSQAHTVMFSWGGTMAVQAYHYANLTRRLRMILIIPGGDHGYIEEGYKVGNIAGGRLGVQHWYEAGEHLHHYMQPNTNVKLRALPSADMDDLTADDFEFHDGAFGLLHPDDDDFFSQGWSEDTRVHEVSTRRRLVYNRLLQSTAEERRTSRALVQQQLQRLYPAEPLPAFFRPDFDVSRNYFLSLDDTLPPSPKYLVWCNESTSGNVIALALRVNASSRRLVPEPRVSAWTGLEADVGRTVDIAEDLRLAVSDFLTPRLPLSPTTTAEPRRGTASYFWLVPSRVSVHISEMAQFFISSLGHHLVHGRTFEGAVFIVPKLHPDFHAVIADLARLVRASLLELPNGAVTSLPGERMFVGPLLSAQWLQVTASGHLMAAFLVDRLNVSSIQERRRAACFLPDSSFVNDAKLKQALERRNISWHLSLSPSDALAVVNGVSTLIVPYGPAVQYYLSFWGGTRRILKLVILCPPWAHFHCATGPFVQRPRWYYSLGQAFGGRNTEVRYVLTGDEFDREDDVFDFDGIPSSASFKSSTWQEQRPEDVERLRQAFQKNRKMSRREGS